MLLLLLLLIIYYYVYGGVKIEKTNRIIKINRVISKTNSLSIFYYLW